MKGNKYIEVCDIPILKGKFLLVCTDDYKWVNNKFNAPDFIDATNYAISINVTFKETDAYLIVLNLWKETPIYASVITHEVNHIVNLLFKNRDWTKLKNDEPESYVKEWFANKVWQMLEKNKLNKLISLSNPHQ